MRLQKEKKKPTKIRDDSFHTKSSLLMFFLIQMQKKKKKLSCSLNKWKLDLPKIS